MTRSSDDSRHERLLGLAMAKGWIHRDQMGDGGWASLLATGALGSAQAEALERELDRDLERALGSSGPSRSDSGSGASSIFSASWIREWAHYEDLVLLAEGGMGRIFKATDTRLHRHVALKILRREDPELERRLLREAELQARVSHPNVCRIYEAGVLNGQAFIAMELVEGDTFRTLAKGWDLRRKLSLMIQACEGVHAAHREGLIHRDLKPSNLMAVEEEGGWRALVLDFGLARTAQTTGLTQSGIVMGTVHYMSPEQARGQDRKLDRRTDLYALGVTLYELLSGRPPFFEFMGLEAVARILSEDPPRLASVADVPRDLDTIVMKCLEKEPSARYDSARALGDELQRVLEGDPILARPLSRSERALRWAAKHRPLVVVGAAGLIATLAFAGFGLRERMLAGRRAAYAQRFGQEAERVEALARYIRLQPPRDLEADWEQLRGRVAQLADEVAAAGRTGEAPGAYALGRAALAQGRPDEARTHLERAWALGFRTPETSLALGQAMAAQYEREVGKASALGDPAQRLKRLEEVARDLGRPAAARLREGASASVEPPAFHAAWLDLLEGRLDGAIASSHRSLDQAPWHFEALRIQAQAWIAKARAATSEGEAERCLGRAWEALVAGRAIARSDRAFLVLQLQRWQESVVMGWRHGRDPLSAIEAQVTLARDLRVLEPHGAAGWAWEGRALGEEARFRAYAGLDPEPWLGRARTASEEARRYAPQDPEACAALASAWRTEGLLRTLRGGDPETALREGLRVAAEGLRADPGSLFLLNLRTACHSILMEHLKTTGRFDPAGEEALLAEYREAAKAHPDQAYHQGNLGTVLLGVAAVEEAMGLDAKVHALEAKEAYERAQQLEPSHLGLSRGLMLARALEARALARQGQNPGPAVLAARAELSRARTAGVPTAELEVVLAVAELAWAEARGPQDPESARLLAGALVRLKESKGFPGEPDYYERALLRAGVIAAEQAPPKARSAREMQASGGILRMARRLPEDPELKALLKRVEALRSR